MCLIAVALDAHPRYPLVIAANRDEFHDRPAAPADWWPGTASVFGGRDLLKGGSWLALARDRRWAVVTNVRRMIPPDPKAPSRGALVADYVSREDDPADYVARLGASATAHPGFNLLVGVGSRAHYATNHPRYRTAALSAGIHAVSNASLDTPWPKLVRLRAALQRWCAERCDDFTPLFAALADSRPAPDEALPDTGVGLETERFLSPPFIRGDRYGTRASTVLAMRADGRVRFWERRFGPLGRASGETQCELCLAAGT
ncbi:Uncharacterized conserved protein, contains NRDE domain [Fontimonas thermophila]|uniref:Uncharacterized conserved protein, contains NRDE domain n=1 Tax=Fontimonas thermophila TaxID=1076937 RepID=A0A1I2H0M9_9GAMM|nr:NRDE family protein [Fontimonas thermophila]SFF22547.1 Uncharacterized conserved protein, contains NRDE domain [Fontimonas thermophila]